MALTFRPKTDTDMPARKGIPRKDQVLLEELRYQGLAVDSPEERVQALREAGIIQAQDHPNNRRGYSEDTVFAQFLALVSVGADDASIMRILGLSKVALQDLRGVYYEMCVDQLSGKGILGTVAESFLRLQEVSRRLVAAMHWVGEERTEIGPKGPVHVQPDLKAMNALAQTLIMCERTRIEMLVKTGAVKPKKRMDASQLFAGSTDKVAAPMLSGADGQRIMEMMLANLDPKAPIQTGGVSVGTVHVAPLNQP